MKNKGLIFIACVVLTIIISLPSAYAKSSNNNVKDDSQVINDSNITINVNN